MVGSGFYRDTLWGFLSTEVDPILRLSSCLSFPLLGAQLRKSVWELSNWGHPHAFSFPSVPMCLLIFLSDSDRDQVSMVLLATTCWFNLGWDLYPHSLSRNFLFDCCQADSLENLGKNSSQTSFSLLGPSYWTELLVGSETSFQTVWTFTSPLLRGSEKSSNHSQPLLPYPSL